MGWDGREWFTRLFGLELPGGVDGAAVGVDAVGDFKLLLKRELLSGDAWVQVLMGSSPEIRDNELSLISGLDPSKFCCKVLAMGVKSPLLTTKETAHAN